MTGTVQRLWIAVLLAIILHGVFLLLQYHKGTKQLPQLLPVQSIKVSLGAKDVPAKRAVEQKELLVEKKREMVSEPEPLVASTKPETALRPELLPEPITDKKPQPAVKPIKREKISPQKEVKPQAPPQEEKTSVTPPQHSPKKDITPAKQAVAKAPKPSSETESEESRSKSKLEEASLVRQATPLYQVNPPPKYPRQARRRGLHGVVQLDVLVDVSGDVAEIKLFTSSGHRLLDRAAIKAVRGWSFTPGTIGGKGIEMWVKVPIRFELR